METTPQRLQVSRFGIGQRLWLAFGIVTLCTIAGGVVSLVVNRAANQQTSALVDVTVPEMEIMGSIQIALLKAMLGFQTYGLTYTEADYQSGQEHLATALATHLEFVALCERAALGDLPLARQIGDDLGVLSKLAEQTHAAVVVQVRAQAEVQDLIEQTTPIFAEHRVKMQAKLATEIAAGEPAETLTGRSKKLAITNRSEQLFMVFVQSIYQGLALRDAECLAVIEKKLQPLRESLQRLRAEHTKPDDQERVDRLLGLIERFGVTALAMRTGIADISRVNRDRADMAGKINQQLTDRKGLAHGQIVGQVAVVESAMVRSLWSIVVCASVSAVVGILASLLLARRIVGPVRRATVALAQVADGDLTAQLAPGGRDEMGLMAAGLNTTVERLRHHRRATGEVAQALHHQAQALTGSSQELSSLAHQTSIQAAAVAQAAEQVNANVATVATAAEELSASVHDIARSSTEAAQVTTEARQLSQHAQGVIAKLSASSTQISTVAKDIESIAQKTNLLALNATIEAASAGEAGRGFAVVANEVKDLARQTAAATADITKKIQEIQAGTADAVGCLGDIASIIGKIDGFEQSISAAVQEQAATTDEITRTATAAAQATQAIVGNIMQVAKATNSTTVTAADIKSTASSLAGQAVQLQTLVNAMRMEIPSSTTIPQVAA